MRRGGVLILLIGLILIVGAGALFLFLQQSTPGGLGSEAASPSPTDDPGVDVVIARFAIPANTVITDATLLELTTIDTVEYNPDQNFTSIGEVLGKLTVNPIEAEELINQRDLTDPGLSQQIPTAEGDRPRDKAYPFQVNSMSGVADQIKPGDTVDVVATFIVTRVVSLPTERKLEEQAGQVVPVTVRERDILETATTKTLIQQVQVLKILRPSITPEETAQAEQPETTGPPAVDSSGQPIDNEATNDTTITTGQWVLILAVNDQEAELIEFAQSTDARISLVLRGAGDDAYEPTIGATFDLLTSEFGVPIPRPLQVRVISEEEALGAEPTLTPAPTRIP